MGEIWKDIQNYEGSYQVSNYGRVKSLSRVDSRGNKRNEKILKGRKNRQGYYDVALCKNGKQKFCRINRLVAQAFIPNPNNYPVINHIDGNKANNYVNNLEWCTYKHNSQEAMELGLLKPNYIGIMKGKFGKQHNKSKKVKQINKYTNEIIAVFDGINEAHRQTGINSGNISACCRKQINFKNGKKWTTKTAGGYKWEFI